MKKMFFLLFLLIAGLNSFASDLSDNNAKAQAREIETTQFDALRSQYNQKEMIVDCCITIQYNISVGGQPTGAFVGCRRCNTDCNLAQLDAVDCARDLLEIIADL